MRIFNILKSIDTRAEKSYIALKQSFFGKVFVKLIGEIILACLIALAVYIATFLYHSSRVVSEDNKKLNQIYISISDEYVDSLFGTPYITISESESLTNKFYVLNRAILRTVSDGEKVIAFFITSTNEQTKIPVSSIESDTSFLGDITYADNEFPNPTTEANISANGRYVYYGEKQETGRYGMFNCYVYGFTPYGFFENATADLINLAVFNSDKTAEIAEVRKEAKPNTFGVISQEYQDHISMIPVCEEWENMYYLLNNVQE